VRKASLAADHWARARVPLGPPWSTDGTKPGTVLATWHRLAGKQSLSDLNRPVFAGDLQPD